MQYQFNLLRSTIYEHNFDYNKFYQWCREKVKEGHVVFVSEYACPEDFNCVCVVEHKTILNKSFPSPRVEKLFRVS